MSCTAGVLFYFALNLIVCVCFLNELLVFGEVYSKLEPLSNFLSIKTALHNCSPALQQIRTLYVEVRNVVILILLFAYNETYGKITSKT
jgi:hypothetical protein